MVCITSRLDINNSCCIQYGKSQVQGSQSVTYITYPKAYTAYSSVSVETFNTNAKVSSFVHSTEITRFGAYCKSDYDNRYYTTNIIWIAVGY